MSNDLTTSDKKLLDYLSREAPDGTLHQYITDLARNIGYSRATVYKSMDKLQSLGLITFNSHPDPAHAPTIQHNLPQDAPPIVQDIVKTKQQLWECHQQMSSLLATLDQQLGRVEDELKCYRESLNKTTNQGGPSQP